MAKEGNERVCAHGVCRCPSREDSDYCSEECEKARSEADCGCGHPECQAQA